MQKELNKFISYFMVGGICALIEWITFYLSNMIFNYFIATIIAFIIATTANYYLGIKYTFKDNDKVNNDFIKVFIVSGIGLLLNILFMYIFVEIIKITYNIISKILATGLVFIWNYISRRLFIYK